MDKWEELKEYLEKLTQEGRYDYSEIAYGVDIAVMKIQYEMDRLEGEDK